MISESKPGHFLTISALVFFTGAFYPYLLERIGDINQNSNSIRLQILFSSIYFFCALITFSRFLNNQNSGFAQFRFSLIFAAILIGSSFWSFDPAITFRNGFAYLGTIFFAITVYAHCRTINKLFFDLFSAIRIGCVSSLLLSIISGQFLSGNGIGYKGVFVHKNTFGAIMSLGLILSIYFWFLEKLKFGLIWTLALTWALFMSKSSSAQITAICAISLLLITLTIRKSTKNIQFMLFSNLIILISIAILYLLARNTSTEEITQFTTGKDSTFTGRTRIWSVAINALKDNHFLYGYGYNSFWFSPESRLLNQYLVGFKNFNTHNGYLEIMLSVGFIGLAYYMFIIFSNLIRSFRDDSFILVLPLTIWFLLSNLTESTFISQNTLLPMMLVFLNPIRKESNRKNE